MRSTRWITALALACLVAPLPAARAASPVLAHPGGAIVFAFDDGCDTHMGAASTLEARGMRGTFFVIAGAPPPDASCDAFLTRANIASLAARGHDVEAHTMTHPHLPLLADDAVRRELADARATLEGITGKTVAHVAYPYGETDPRVSAIAASVYSSARLYYRDLPSMPFDSIDRYGVPAIGIESSTTIDAMHSYVDLAASRGVTLVLVFHDITPTPATFDATPAMLSAVVDYVAASHVPVLTYAQAVGPDVSFKDQGGNEWWAQVALSGGDASRVVRVESHDSGGPWVTLPHQSWGSYAASYHIEPGHTVTFRATLSDGRSVESCAFTHPGAVCSGAAPTTAPSSPPPAPAPPPPSGGAATFSHARGNAWWVETDAAPGSGGAALVGVDARVDGAAWATLARTSWGSWAKSVHAPAGSFVEFRARAADGSETISARYAWPPA